jgi:two-component system OmpR family sensor kinase
MTADADRERLALLVHEVRSPTAALAAISAALADGGLDDDSMLDLVGLALAACRGIERVVDDAVPSSLHVGDADVGEIARAAATGAALGGVRVRAVVASGSLQVRGDPLRLRQALDNLVSNAVSYSPPDGEVVVSVRTEADDVLVSVVDTGAGIPPDQHARIFEPGVRLDTERPGSGLGLTIARSIVEAHGGALTVESSPGAGATFTIVLPRAASS